MSVIRILRQNEIDELRSRLAARSVALDAELLQEVALIIDDVRRRGDEALIEYTRRFDGVELEATEFRISEETLRSSAARADKEILAALRLAIQNVRTFHERQLEPSWEIAPADGVRLGQKITPLERVGLYVPGGTAAYPSSIVMNVVPAQVARVERIVVVTPPRTLAENPAIAAALLQLNVSEIYSLGGAQAVAALAFGTQTIPRVDKITGPGNKYVAAAKKLLFGVVGIDSIAGPSEIVIIADQTARAEFVAADLLAQAEHGEDASAVLLTTSETLAADVKREVERQMESLPRRATVATSLRDYGAIVLVDNLDEACAIVNELAPEHVEIVTRDDEAMAAKIKHAGAIFFGSYTPEAVGDYLAGPNHVLPTGRTARFSSALGVYDFVKRTNLLQYSADAFNAVAESIDVLAQCEGLAAHARSASIRKE
jgi:histidinol dehydrogenase